MKPTKFHVREVSVSDQAFLREMLYHSLYVPEGSISFPREVVNRPEITKYVEGWGRNGDLGFIAVDSSTNEPIGAAWLRLFKESDKGYGYVDDRTPELGLAVLPEHRGRGVGSMLLTRLLKAAEALYDSVSLSVSADNRALRLYERAGFKPYRTSGSSVTMLNQLRKNADRGDNSPCLCNSLRNSNCARKERDSDNGKVSTGMDPDGLHRHSQRGAS